MTDSLVAPLQAVLHLLPEVWAHVNRAVIAKAIGEFAHELLIEPRLVQQSAGASDYVLPTDRCEVEYRFRARRMSLDHWAIDRQSLCKLVHGQQAPLDAHAFVIELRELLQLREQVLPEYLEELANTLYGAAYKHVHQRHSAAELAQASFQEVETGMTEGHPIFVANNGRIGFNARDYRAYAPEAAAPQALVWLAAARERTDFACTADLAYAALMRDELGSETLASFARTLRERGLDPDAYLLLPVHPWQWENRLVQLFATDLARGDLVYLGRGPDQYLAQQSIRTFFNVSQPQRRYVKTSLTIRNMGFTRGMSAVIASSATAVNDWVRDLVNADAYLARNGFSVLREVAFIGYRHRHYQRAIRRPADSYKEMLAALWRENPCTGLQPGERLMTMAALMHLDREGKSLLTALIESSGVGIDTWLQRYLSCYLKPQLHCFYAHRLVFTPHCENVILVLRDGLPVRAIIKDIAEDIGVLNPQTPLPASIARIGLRVPEEVMTLSIFTDVFDCVFRFLGPLLQEHAHYPEQRFWRLVADCIRDYEREQPQLGPEFQRYDLFAPTFIRNCLNRLQLRNNRQMIDLNAPDPVDSLQFAGTLDNPIAAFRPARELPQPPAKESHGTL